MDVREPFFTGPANDPRNGTEENRKRIERIWRREGLKVPQRQPKRGRLWLNNGSCIRLRPEYPGRTWSYDFVEGRPHDGRKYRILSIIDEASRDLSRTVRHARGGDAPIQNRTDTTWKTRAMMKSSMASLRRQEARRRDRRIRSGFGSPARRPRRARRQHAAERGADRR